MKRSITKIIGQTVPIRFEIQNEKVLLRGYLLCTILVICFYAFLATGVFFYTNESKYLGAIIYLVIQLGLLGSSALLSNHHVRKNYITIVFFVALMSSFFANEGLTIGFSMDFTNQCIFTILLFSARIALRYIVTYMSFFGLLHTLQLLGLMYMPPHMILVNPSTDLAIGVVARLIVTVNLVLYFKYYHGRKLDLKKDQLQNYINIIKEKSNAIESLTTNLDEIKEENPEQKIIKIEKLLQSNILTSDAWENFKRLFQEVHPGFFTKLRYEYPNISAADQRLLALAKLNLSIKECASILGISPESVKKSRYRLKKKLNLEDSESIESFVDNLL